MVIGTLGSKIIFEVSDKQVLTFQTMTREIAGRWTEHEVAGVKPKPEYLGPSNQVITLTISLSAALGVRPRAVLEAVAAMVEGGIAEYLIIGTAPVGKNPFRLTSSSETWDKLYSKGQLAKATMSITLEEYT